MATPTLVARLDRGYIDEKFQSQRSIEVYRECVVWARPPELGGVPANDRAMWTIMIPLRHIAAVAYNETPNPMIRVWFTDQRVDWVTTPRAGQLAAPAVCAGDRDDGLPSVAALADVAGHQRAPVVVVTSLWK